MSNLQANDVSGSTLTEAMSSNSNATNPADVSKDEFAMEDIEDDENSSEGSKNKWPKLPGTGKNGFGFQRFQ